MNPRTTEEPTTEHAEWHTRMWDQGARVFFVNSQFVKHAFKAGKTIGRFSVLLNKELIH